MGDVGVKKDGTGHARPIAHARLHKEMGQAVLIFFEYQHRSILLRTWRARAIASFMRPSDTNQLTIVHLLSKSLFPSVRCVPSSRDVIASGKR